MYSLNNRFSPGVTRAIGFTAVFFVVNEMIGLAARLELPSGGTGAVGNGGGFDDGNEGGSGPLVSLIRSLKQKVSSNIYQLDSLFFPSSLC